MKELDIRVNKKYRLKRKIGGGSFGVVYIAIDLNTNEEVAIKLEHKSIQPGYLKEEYETYKRLAGGVGIPKVYWFGLECEYDALVFELLGPSLADLFSYCRHKFSLKTVLMIADQLISRLQYLHGKNVIQRDIKPDNLLMGTGKNGNTIYVTDMGLAEEFYERKESVKLPTESHLIGTSDFASITGHHGVEESRKDDMESLGYVLLYFLHRNLPWN